MRCTIDWVNIYIVTRLDQTNKFTSTNMLMSNEEWNLTQSIVYVNWSNQLTRKKELIFQVYIDYLYIYTNKSEKKKKILSIAEK